ncbi:MAG: SlyX family protein [Deltaproteobacteria bacterium]|nr:MAG: SlyX family protein [Deltaproteobacteria bacterium]
MDELHERLEELEIRYTHQARLIEELNEVLTDACARLARLEQENRDLREQLRQAAPDDFTLSPDE